MPSSRRARLSRPSAVPVGGSRLLLLLVAAGLAGPAGAAGSPQRADRDETPPAAYEEGRARLEEGDFEAARVAFELAASQAPRNPDVLNMLAFSQRKSGLLDRAIQTYQRALRLRPRFPQAREYLAEAHLQAALRELAVLESYGDEGRSERDRLIRALEQAAMREAWSAGGESPPKSSW